MSDSSDSTKMHHLGEEEIVRRLVAGLSQGERVLVGPGDDCAVIDAGGEDLLLLKTDAVVAGVHFLSETDPARVGWKAAARVVSDFAAMGGRAEELLVTVAVPEDCAMAWLEGLYRGLTCCAQEYGASIVGGETVGLPAGAAAMISVAGTGRVERGRVVTRAGGQVGDGIWVTGRLGGSFASERHLDFLPRVAEGQWLAAHATAMMDLSDGIRRDLPRLADASGWGFELWREMLPRQAGCSVEQALSEGEDMELIFTAAEGAWEDEFRRTFPSLELTRIGTLTPGERSDLGSGGWQHFTTQSA
ncbi:thiamine-phosphate kinase [Roseibacillus ishigakijimensis]|uniref:Thiamine-monophosphate kinase n=1 Tax=Roseibacillus ishigakijimensis TaxID=454146 RepID=A0A934VLY4_9BACT|nr:thiamine-phosphate kinase [Roseibacillus ishigakijimensis]MBK1833702.1 thiamine-phosphate kinase [Roseibacillus ishigakijimensis]